jgi:hypothetical protein
LQAYLETVYCGDLHLLVYRIIWCCLLSGAITTGAAAADQIT